MRLEHLPALLQANFVVVNCVFPNSTNAYSYKCPKALEPKEGDEFVISTPSGETKIVTCVKVAGPETLDYNANYRYRWVVQKVNKTDYLKIMEMEDTLLKQLKSAQHQQKVNEAIAGLVGNGAPEVAKLIDEYRKEFQ